MAGEQLAGNIGKNVAPNIGYMLGKTPNYTNSNQAKIERLENEIKDLRRRNNRLSVCHDDVKGVDLKR